MMCVGAIAIAACSRSSRSSPSDVVVQFYTMRDAIGIQGAPAATELAALRPFIADALAGALASADTLRRSGTIPAADSASLILRGDLFSSLFEGPSTFRVMPPTTSGGVVLVPVACTSDRVRPAVRWTDTMVVVKQGDRFVVQDIRFGGMRGTNVAPSLLARLANQRVRS